jgi:hypothetical protein
MKRSVAALVLALAGLSMWIAPAAHAGGASGTFQLISNDDFGQAANGDHVLVTGTGTFSVHPKSISATGNFTHFDPEGNVVAEGTWTATELLSLNFYGCRFIPALGVDLGDDNLCGGALKMRVVLDTPTGQLPAILTIFCIVGPKAPASHNTPPGEGVTLNIPGIINFNHTAHGNNIYVRAG